MKKSIKKSMKKKSFGAINLGTEREKQSRTTNFKKKVKIGIIIPFRNDELGSRLKQLNIFRDYFIDFFRHNNSTPYEYKIYVMTQTFDGNKFNRGKLLNLGYLYAKRDNCDIFIFHDVDLLPTSDKVMLKYYTTIPPKGTLFHIAKSWDRYTSSDKYSYLGGIVSFNSSDFELINGFPNDYWGWGGEDDELNKRVEYFKILKESPPFQKGSIIDLEKKNLSEKLESLRLSGEKNMRKFENNKFYNDNRENYVNGKLKGHLWGHKELYLDNYIKNVTIDDKETIIIKLDLNQNYSSKEIVKLGNKKYYFQSGLYNSTENGKPLGFSLNNLGEKNRNMWANQESISYIIPYLCEVYKTGEFIDVHVPSILKDDGDEDNVKEEKVKLIDSTSPIEGRYLYNIMTNNNFFSAVEVGMAMGVSGAWICQALKYYDINFNSSKLVVPRLVSIDPNQDTQYKNRGIKMLERCKLNEYSFLIKKKSYEAFHDLFFEKEENLSLWKQDTINLVYIDGWHTFDYTYVDFFMSSLLLDVGGVIVIDDIRHKGVNACCEIIKSDPRFKKILNNNYTQLTIIKSNKYLWEIEKEKIQIVDLPSNGGIFYCYDDYLLMKYFGKIFSNSREEISGEFEKNKSLEIPEVIEQEVKKYVKIVKKRFDESMFSMLNYVNNRTLFELVIIEEELFSYLIVLVFYACYLIRKDRKIILLSNDEKIFSYISTNYKFLKVINEGNIQLGDNLSRKYKIYEKIREDDRPWNFHEIF